MTATAARAFTALREFARERPIGERCDLCATPLAEVHDHLLDGGTHRLVCVCPACGCLLGENADGRWALVRRRMRRLVDFHLTDEDWRALGMPVELVFFLRDRGGEQVMARYPSPGGPVESAVEPSAWEALVVANPALGRLAPGVEALLVNRAGDRRDYYLVSIDECYRLVGILRRHWHGFSGGAEVGELIARFFAELGTEARP